MTAPNQGERFFGSDIDGCSPRWVLKMDENDLQKGCINRYYPQLNVAIRAEDMYSPQMRGIAGPSFKKSSYPITSLEKKPVCPDFHVQRPRKKYLKYEESTYQKSLEIADNIFKKEFKYKSERILGFLRTISYVTAINSTPTKKILDLFDSNKQIRETLGKDLYARGMPKFSFTFFFDKMLNEEDRAVLKEKKSILKVLCNEAISITNKKKEKPYGYNYKYFNAEYLVSYLFANHNNRASLIKEHKSEPFPCISLGKHILTANGTGVIEVREFSAVGGHTLEENKKVIKDGINEYLKLSNLRNIKDLLIKLEHVSDVEEYKIPFNKKIYQLKDKIGKINEVKNEDINQPIDSNGNTILHLACLYSGEIAGNVNFSEIGVEDIKTILEIAPELLNNRNTEKERPLDLAKESLDACESDNANNEIEKATYNHIKSISNKKRKKEVLAGSNTARKRQKTPLENNVASEDMSQFTKPLLEKQTVDDTAQKQKEQNLNILNASIDIEDTLDAVRDYDVVFKKGGGNYHLGNIWYRGKIIDLLPSYIKANKDERKIIERKIVGELYNKTPAVRFFKYKKEIDKLSELDYTEACNSTKEIFHRMKYQLKKCDIPESEKNNIFINSEGCIQINGLKINSLVEFFEPYKAAYLNQGIDAKKIVAKTILDNFLSKNPEVRFKKNDKILNKNTLISKEETIECLVKMFSSISEKINIGILSKQPNQHKKAILNEDVNRARDVILGKGRSGDKYPGNIACRKIIDNCLNDYESSDIAKKKSIIHYVIDEFSRQYSSARFLKPDKKTGNFYETTKQEIYSIIQQMFVNRTHKPKKAASHPIAFTKEPISERIKTPRKTQKRDENTKVTPEHFINNNVVLGRGRRGDKYPGNIACRKIIDNCLNDYEAFDLAMRKSIIHYVIDEFSRQYPSARFLKPDKKTGNLYETNKQEICSVIRKMFTNRVHKRKKAIERDLDSTISAIQEHNPPKQGYEALKKGFTVYKKN